MIFLMLPMLIIFLFVQEDVLENNFNVLRMFVRIYGALTAPSMLVSYDMLLVVLIVSICDLSLVMAFILL